MATNVSVNGHKAHIRLNDLLLSDPEVLCHLSGLNPEQICHKILTATKIGLIAMERLENHADLDYVRTEFERLSGKFRTQLDHRFQAFDEGMDKRLEVLDKTLNPDVKTSYLHKLAQVLESYFSQGGSVDQLFDPNNDDSPLGKLKQVYEKRAREILDALLVRQTKLETIQKGENFEDDCQDSLTDIVSQTGDQLYRTSTEAGLIKNDKTGDFVVHTKDDPDTSIVFEMKAGTSRQSLPKTLSLLDRALENRAAQYAVLVAEYVEALPKSHGYMFEYGQDKLIIALGSKEQGVFVPEILTIALQIARSRLDQSRQSKTTFDPGQVSKAIDEINGLLGRFARIKTQCSNIDKASGAIRDEADNLKTELKEKLAHIDRLLTAQ